MLWYKYNTEYILTKAFFVINTALRLIAFMICLRLQNKDDMFKHTWHFTTKGRDGGGIVHASPKDITYLFYGEQRVTIVSCLHKAVRELTFLTLRFYHNNYLRTWGPAMHCLARQGLWKVLVAFQLKRDRRATEARRGPAHTRTRTRRELHSGTVWKRIPPGGWAAREIGYVSFFFRYVFMFTFLICIFPA